MIVQLQAQAEVAVPDPKSTVMIHIGNMITTTHARLAEMKDWVVLVVSAAAQAPAGIIIPELVILQEQLHQYPPEEHKITSRHPFVHRVETSWSLWKNITAGTVLHVIVIHMMIKLSHQIVLFIEE